MEKYRCKLCLRKFGNGRALGGHMRSHIMNLHVTSTKSEDFLQVLSSPSSEKDEENPKKNGGLVDLESSVVVQDRESDTESSKEQKDCRRSKRVIKSRISDTNTCSFDHIRKANEASLFGQAEPVSSISETSPEADVAYCLMMLSRDKWEIEESGDGDGDNDYEDDDDVDVDVKVKKGRSRGKYRCESCNKVFRSYQALGGHRASHKKMRISVKNNEISTSKTTRKEAFEMKMEEKIHECPVCYRVFSSGQALGGHKRSHGTIANAIANASVVDKPVSRFIDLNLPAPIDDDDDVNDDEDLISQMEVSAVSD